MYVENIATSFKYQPRVCLLKVMSCGLGLSVDNLSCLELRGRKHLVYQTRPYSWEGSCNLFFDILGKWVILILSNHRRSARILKVMHIVMIQDVPSITTGMPNVIVYRIYG